MLSVVLEKQTEQGPTTKNDLGVDAVSRQAVLNTLDSMNSALDEDRTVETYKELLKECYKVLPSVTPQPRKGHWIPTYGNVECSVCGSVKDSRDIGKATHYCDFCGAMMVEPQKSEEV